ncbi:MAG: toll/interleukin-1 receptor domain-containing protein [Desulfarculaceae bacterium]|nr:toll/interleukin-1 receptor domain-containing protein [Desulfarculaceae bacterium]
MANPEHVKILKQGVKVWNRWRKNNPDIKPDLFEADFANADLTDANLDGAALIRANLANANLNRTSLVRASLTEANLVDVSLTNGNLTEANLRMAHLIDANFSGGNFHKADLSDANLMDAKLIEAELVKTNLNKAVLYDANFSRANVKGANLSDAEVGWTVFANLDLSKAIGLEYVKHEGPSTIGIDTIYQSKGDIPESFLRGCGVPEDLIKLIPSLLSQPFDFYSCFISYSSKDDSFSRRLYADLRESKVRVWFAPEDMKIGDKIRERIDQTIRIHDKLLLVLSEQSIESQWVEKEVETAFEQERRNPGKTVLFPIRLDDAVMETNKAWAADIRRTRHIGDFTDWKDHDSYKKAFDRLLRDLKASEK